jgi:hypothetical protein
MNTGHSIGFFVAIAVFSLSGLYSLTDTINTNCDEYTPNVGRLTFTIGRSMVEGFTIMGSHDTKTISRGLEYLDYSLEVTKCHPGLEYEKDLHKYLAWLNS